MERVDKTGIKEKEVKIVADRSLAPKIDIIHRTAVLNTTQQGASCEDEQVQPHTWR